MRKVLAILGLSGLSGSLAGLIVGLIIQAVRMTHSGTTHDNQ